MFNAKLADIINATRRDETLNAYYEEVAVTTDQDFEDEMEGLEELLKGF